ncbi:MAG: DUF2946 family protein [Gallionella sp.]
MLLHFKKFVAVLLAVWLPIFSGSALAASAAMQTMGGDCRSAAVQPDEYPSHHLSDAHRHAPVVANQTQATGHYDQQNSSCKNCGICHFACSGYLATVAVEITETQPLVQSFTPSSTQFKSFTSAPLDPPPLARV